MRLFLVIPLLFLGLSAAQDPMEIRPPSLHDKEPEKRLPNGKLQSDEILKQDYQNSIKDVHQLVTLTQQLESDMQRETGQVLSLGDLKRLDEIERIAKRIRGRMRRF